MIVDMIDFPRLSRPWETQLEPHFDLAGFYLDLRGILSEVDPSSCCPRPGLVFRLFDRLTPEAVSVVLLGEDPYPRQTSAQGIAFWDAEIENWTDRTRGNCLPNMLKALLVARGEASYHTPIGVIRERIERGQLRMPSPGALFEHWLAQGVFLLNTALTYAGKAHKRRHHRFWREFNAAVLRLLASLQRERGNELPFILWGRKAQGFVQRLGLNGIRTICQGHPTFLHQFMDPARPTYSPFSEIEAVTGFSWI